MRLSLPQLAVLASCCLLATGCRPQSSTRIDYQMGEKAAIGPLTYTVIETAWRSQLGDGLTLRAPQQRFFMVSLSVTNGGAKTVSMPLLQIEDANGHTYVESENGAGVDNWFGLLRNIPPAQSQTGRLLFDVPLSSYRLRLTDGGDPGMEKYAFITIPLHMDVETNVDPPQPAGR